jgi:DNA-binding IclR family transcriptional regulator
VTDGPRRTPGAESGRRLLGALLAFTPQDPTPTVAELAETVGVPTSTAYRYLALLRETGLVEAAGDGTYRLTDRVTALSAAASAARDDILELATPQLRLLRDTIDETVLLARRGGDFAYCIAREESSHPVRLQFAVGQAMPLHSGSVARVLLAAMPTGERLAYLRAHTSTTTPRNAALLTEAALAKVQMDGWTESYEEVDAGIWGVAAAITRGVGGEVIAGLGTAGPLHRLDEDRRRLVTEKVRATAASMSASLGV